MTLQWCDDFGSYGMNTAFMLDGAYAEVGGSGSASGTNVLVADPDPLATGTVFRTSADAATQAVTICFRKVLLSGQATVGAALRMWMSNLPSNTNHSPVPFSFRNASNQALVALRVETTGAVTVKRGTGLASDPTLGTSSGPVLVANGWQHIEMKVVFHAETGSVEVRVDGVPVISEPNIDTLGALSGPCAQMAVAYDRQAAAPSQNTYFKDLVIYDGTGDYNNDFLGNVHVIPLITDADVSLNWAPSSGSTGFNLIDESPPNDSGYISADDAPPAPAVMSLTNLPEDVTSVKGLMTLVRAWKTDGGDGNLQVSLVSNSVDADGADRPVTVAPTYWYDISEEDPDNPGNPWTPTAVDAAQIKFNRTV